MARRTRRWLIAERRWGKYIANRVVRFWDYKPVSPCPGYRVSYRYGVKNNRYVHGYHTGEDYAAPEGARLNATSYGTVVFAGWGGNAGGWGSAYGFMVVVEQNSKFRKTGKPLRYAYCHLSDITVKVGDSVHPGRKIGEVGATGNATGNHVHYEVRKYPWRYGDDVAPYNAKRRRKPGR